MIKKHFKKFVSLALAAVMVMGMSVTAFASEQSTDSLHSDYSEIAGRAKPYGIPFSMTFEEYEVAFEDSGFSSTQEYANAYLGLLEPPRTTYSSSSSGSDKWYYNTDTTLPSNATPNYSKYKLYDKVKKGDIILKQTAVLELQDILLSLKENITIPLKR